MNIDIITYDKRLDMNVDQHGVPKWNKIKYYNKICYQHNFTTILTDDLLFLGFFPFPCQVGHHVIDMNQAILHFHKLTFHAYKLFNVTHLINKMTLHLFVHVSHNKISKHEWIYIKSLLYQWTCKNTSKKLRVKEKTT